jgi:hypothetical protein
MAAAAAVCDPHDQDDGGDPDAVVRMLEAQEVAVRRHLDAVNRLVREHEEATRAAKLHVSVSVFCMRSSVNFLHVSFAARGTLHSPTAQRVAAMAGRSGHSYPWPMMISWKLRTWPGSHLSPSPRCACCASPQPQVTMPCK